MTFEYLVATWSIGSRIVLVRAKLHELVMKSLLTEAWNYEIMEKKETQSERQRQREREADMYV